MNFFEATSKWGSFLQGRLIACVGLTLALPLAAISQEQTDDLIEVDAGAVIELEIASLFDLPPVVLIETNKGNIPIQLTPEEAPVTVSNFLRYSDEGLYDNSFIHRSINSFVVQGGGFFFDTSGESPVVTPVPTYDPIVNEPNVSNTRGTVAMAKLGGDPDSATSQWFFNLGDNSANLDEQNGGFTVFGRVLGNGMEVVDAIAALTRYDLTEQLGGAFTDVPLSEPLLDTENFVVLNAFTRLPPQITGTTFPDGGEASFSVSHANGLLTIEVSSAAPAGEYRLQIEGTTSGGVSETVERTLKVNAVEQNSWYSGADELDDGWVWLSWFGAFNLTNEPWIFHEAHGWLYPFAESADSIFFWEGEMNSIIWTSDTVYPSVYRFSDGKWLYYQVGTTNPRWFVDLSTGEWEQW